MGQYFGLSPVIKRGPTTVPGPSIPFPFFNNTPILEPFEFTKEAMDFPVQHKKLSLDIKELVMRSEKGGGLGVRNLRFYNGATGDQKAPNVIDLLRERRSKSMLLETLQHMSGRPPLIVYEQNTNPKARKEEGVAIHPTFSVSVLLGKRDEPMLVACGRQIIEHISNAGSSRSLVLSLGLRDHSLPTLKGIVSAVTENCLW
ncbi:putative cinnamoyl-CoA reductase 1-like [Capsicum annuum]|nr:putative cinnamoyl-CoA reductase 1-like [Capsicum annuum]